MNKTIRAWASIEKAWNELPTDEHREAFIKEKLARAHEAAGKDGET